MNMIQILFTFLGFVIFKAMILSTGAYGTTIEFPTLEIPEFDYEDPGSCGGFIDCTEYLADVLKVVVLGIVDTIVFIFNLLVYMGELFVLIFSIAFAGIDGAPWWVNLILYAPLIAAASVIVYKAIRSGNTES